MNTSHENDLLANSSGQNLEQHLFIGAAVAAIRGLETLVSSPQRQGFSVLLEGMEGVEAILEVVMPILQASLGHAFSDIGKASPYFQKYIKEIAAKKEPPSDDWSFGAESSRSALSQETEASSLPLEDSFSEAFPLHHEISWAISSLLAKKIDQDLAHLSILISRASQLAYLHHALRERSFKTSSGWMNRPYNRNEVLAQVFPGALDNSKTRSTHEALLHGFLSPLKTTIEMIEVFWLSPGSFMQLLCEELRSSPADRVLATHRVGEIFQALKKAAARLKLVDIQEELESGDCQAPPRAFPPLGGRDKPELSRLARLHLQRSLVIEADRFVSRLSAHELNELATSNQLLLIKIPNLLKGLLPRLWQPISPQEVRKNLDALDPASSERDRLQRELASSAARWTTAVAKAPSGFGKTRVGLLWAINQGALFKLGTDECNVDKEGGRLLWVTSRNDIAQNIFDSIGKDLRALGFKNLSYELFLAGARVAASDNAPEEDFSANIIITNIDNLLAPYTRHAWADRILSMNSAPTVFDECHEFVSSAPLFALFLVLMKARHDITMAPSLLLSATHLPFWPLFVNQASSDRLAIVGSHLQHQNPHQEVRAQLTAWDGQSLEPLQAVLQHGGAAVTNSRHAAQSLHLAGKKQRTTDLFYGVSHSYYEGPGGSDKSRVMQDVYRVFGEESCCSNLGASLISAPRVQAGLNVSFPHLAEIVASPESSLQRLGRLQRFLSEIGRYRGIDPTMLFISVYAGTATEEQEPEESAGSPNKQLKTAKGPRSKPGSLGARRKLNEKTAAEQGGESSLLQNERSAISSVYDQKLSKAWVAALASMLGDYRDREKNPTFQDFLNLYNDFSEKFKKNIEDWVFSIFIKSYEALSLMPSLRPLQRRSGDKAPDGAQKKGKKRASLRSLDGGVYISAREVVERRRQTGGVEMIWRHYQLPSEVISCDLQMALGILGNYARSADGVQHGVANEYQTMLNRNQTADCEENLFNFPLKKKLLAREMVSEERIVSWARKANSPLPVSSKSLGDKALVYHVIETEQPGGSFVRTPGEGLIRVELLKKYFK